MDGLRLLQEGLWKMGMSSDMQRNYAHILIVLHVHRFYYLKPNVDLNSASRGDDFFPDPDALAEYINSSPKMRKIYGLTRVEIKTKEKPLSRSEYAR